MAATAQRLNAEILTEPDSWLLIPWETWSALGAKRDWVKSFSTAVVERCNGVDVKVETYRVSEILACLQNAAQRTKPV